MNVDDLERAVAKEDWAAIVRGAKKMTEGERRALAKPAVEVATSLVTGQRRGAYRRATELPERLARHGKKKGSAELRDMHYVAELALFAFAGETQLPKSIPDDSDFYEAAVVDILDERRPPWLASWVAKLLMRDVRDQVITWRVVRPLVQRGAIARPKGDGYIALLASPWTRHLVDFQDTTPRDLLLADGALLEHEVWKLFEIDTRAFRRDTYFDPSWDWANALVELSRERQIDRARLLDATLTALGRRFQPATHAGLCVLHGALEATPDERAKREAAYRNLLRHSVPRVRKLASTALAAPAASKPSPKKPSPNKSSPSKSSPSKSSPSKSSPSKSSPTKPQASAPFPAPPATWNPRWKPVKVAKGDLAKRPLGTVLAYRAGRFRASPHCLVLKVSADKWLGMSGSDEEHALAEWRQFASKPPQARSEAYMSDAETMACLALAPDSVRLASEAVTG